MESELTTTAFSRGFVARRDLAAPRRAYLDTYAKRRAGVTELPAAVTNQQRSLQQVQPQKAVVHVVPLVKTQSSDTAHTAEQQPAVDTFLYSHTPTTQPKVASTAVASKKSYLDTLVQRHENAVAHAPAALETVFEPVQNESDTLFETAEQQTQLQANLRALYSDESLIQSISKNTKSASSAHVRTIVASAFMCGVMAVGIFTFIGKYSYQPVIAQPIASPVIEVEASAATPKNVPVVNNQVAPTVDYASQPVKLLISGIGVNAPVEAIGTTPEGLIAVPNAYGVVGWYNKSSVPGKPGPVVLVGHYAGGNNAVFDNLKNVKNGDLITTTSGKGKSLTYRVTAKNEYEKDKVPMAEIFKAGSSSRLEIITCSGKWQSNTYNNRLVVTAELVK